MTSDRASKPGRPTGRTRAAILGYLRRHPGSTPRSAADGIGMNRETVKKALQRLAADGEVTVVGERGHYFVSHGLALVPSRGDIPQGESPAGDISLATVPGDTAVGTNSASQPPGCHPRCPQCGWRAMQPVPAGKRARCEMCGLGFPAEDGTVPR